MKKRVFLLIPLILVGLTACVKYNGQGKNGPKSSAAPSSEATNVSSQEAGTSEGGQPSSQTPNSSVITPSSAPTSQAQEGDLPVGTAVKVYLVFGEYGLYKGNPVNTSVDALFLEHTMELATKVGDDLPGKADVTSSVTGSQFVAWTAYNNDGSLTSYTKVPAVDHKVLYASFSGGNGQGGQSSQPAQSSSQPQSSEPQPSSSTPSSSQPAAQYTYTVTELPDWIQDDGCVIFAWVWSPTDGGSWKSLTYGTNHDASFTVSNSELDGFLMARCVGGTTQPDWEMKSGNEPGRIYNKTNDINCSAGVYSYVCSSWVGYPS